MADIQFTKRKELEAGWRLIAWNEVHQLAVWESPSPYEVDVQRLGDIVVAVLSNDVKAVDLMEAIRGHREKFMEGLRLRWPAAGVIWNVSTDECCIFRDIWGFVIWGVSRIQNDMECTTSPEIFGRIVHGRALNDVRMASYLLQTEDDYRFDFFEHTERIFPGECLILARDCDAFFDAVLRNGCGEAADSVVRVHRISYWANRCYRSFDASYEELVPELRRELIDAASRIGARDDLCFTLSGGLDSSGILSAYCSVFGKSGDTKFDAMSLVSKQHPSCDESRELDVLESALPIRLWRVNMDETWTLSRPDLYEKYPAWGPMAAPGIESILFGYEQVEQLLGPRTIVTGYGGNVIVKVRMEAMLRHILHQVRAWKDLPGTIAALDRQTIRYLLARIAGNRFGGRLYAIYRRMFGHDSVCERCLSPVFAAQFGAHGIDPFFAMSHMEERANIPSSWNWEYIVRCLDKLARLVKHRFYEPLLDPVLYDFCAQIPPQYFKRNGEYRKIYKDALAVLLPQSIIAHPKSQFFDDMSHEGLAGRKVNDIRARIAGLHAACIDTKALMFVYGDYLAQVAKDREQIELIQIWRPLSLCFWQSP